MNHFSFLTPKKQIGLNSVGEQVQDHSFDIGVDPMAFFGHHAIILRHTSAHNVLERT